MKALPLAVLLTAMSCVTAGHAAQEVNINKDGSVYINQSSGNSGQVIRLDVPADNTGKIEVIQKTNPAVQRSTTVQTGTVQAKTTTAAQPVKTPSQLSLVNTTLADKSYAAQDLSRSSFVNVEFNNMNFNGVNFTGASFSNVTFTGGDFTGVNVDGASFVNVEFIGTRIKGTDFLKATMVNTDLSQAVTK